MKRILLLLSLVTSMAYGQVNNTAATNFTNSLEASRIFNLPVLIATPPVGIKVGGLSYNTALAKLASWNGTSWVYYLTELNAQNTYVPLTRSITINGVTQDLSVNRNWNIATTIVDAIPTSGSTNAVSSGGTFNALALKGNLAGGNNWTNGQLFRIDGTYPFFNVLGGTSFNISNVDGSLNIGNSIGKSLSRLSSQQGSTSNSQLASLTLNTNNLSANTTNPTILVPNEALLTGLTRTVTLIAPPLSGTLARLEDIPTATGGTVTSFSKTDGFGITSSITNPTTTPNHSIAVDSTQVRTVNNSLSKSQVQTALNTKQNQLSGTGFVKATGTTIIYDNTSYYPSSNPSGYTSNTGTVTSFSKTDGFGVLSSVTSPTTTPNHNISVDTAVIRTTSNSASLAQLQNKFNSDAILNNTTIIPEAKKIYTLDSINTVSTLKGGSLNIVTPITFPAYPGNPYSARDFYAFKTSKTRIVGGRLGIFNTQYDPTGIIQGVERERWFFGTGGLMVFLPGKTTGDSHSGGILIGDRQLTSKSLFGFYTDSNNGYIAYSRDTASYNFTPTVTKNILSYDSLGNVRQLLSGGSFSTAGIDKYDTDLSATYTDRTKPDVGYVNTNYIKNQTATPQSASFNISGSAQSLNVISGGIASSSGNTYGSFTVGSFNGTNAVPMQMVRNQVDAIPLLILNQANASATGDIFRANFNNVNKFKVDYRGVIGVNNTLLTSLQSFRTNASGTASEAFTAQSLITLTTTGAGAATFNQSTGALNIPTNSGGGTGTVTSVATTSNNGISGTVTNSTTTPSIALTADTSILRTTANSLTLSQLQTKLNGYESISNKQNSLATDATNLKYPTVNAVNTGLANYLTLGTPQTVTGRKTFNAEIIGNSDLTLPGASILANGDINTVGAVDASGGGHFNSIVTCPAIPTNGIDLTNKTYVDGRISTSLTAYELIANKQNSLATDVTNTKYPTVTAINTALANYVTTNSSQTGIGGTKEWTGIHRFLNPILVGVTTGFNVTYSGTGTVVTTNGGTTSFSQAIPLKSGTYALVEDLPQYISVPSGTTSVSLIGNATYGFHATTLTTATLPSVNPAEGTLITLIGIGSGQFRISQNASQYIVSGNATTTVGTAGYIQTTTNNTTITIRYLDTNRWQVTSSNSAPTIN